MSNIRVSYAEIEQAASNLSQGREEITGRLQALQQQIQDLIASGFVTDQASVKFGEAYVAYTTSASSVAARLGEMQGFLLQTATVLREMDSQLAARIQ